jgi:phage gpG-like protein
MFEVKVTDKGVRATLDQFGQAAVGEISKAVATLSIQLSAYVKDKKLSGQVLRVRTGTLRRSITHRIGGNQEKIEGVVGTNLIYAGIHEFGGKTKPHVIEAKKAQALHFTRNGKSVFAKRVFHTGSTMPERSYLRSSLHEMAPTIKQTLNAAVGKALGK